ncbi:MAG: hypothetical protein QXY01_06015 [Candidatus Bathyarchaeia archaeon]
MKNYKVLILLSSILMILSSTAFLSAIASRESIESPELENPVTIDGRWTSHGEWSDALEIRLAFVQGSGEAYARVKHDGESLYVLIDYLSLRAVQIEDSAMAFIDTKNDGGEIPQRDDFILMCMYLKSDQAWTFITWGTGDRTLEDIPEEAWEAPPEGFSAASSTDAEDDPYSPEDHAIWEFKIPRSEFKSEKIGFAAAVFSNKHGNAACYPLTDLNKPRDWAEVEFSDKTLSELKEKSATTETGKSMETSEAKAVFTSEQAVGEVKVALLPGWLFAIIGIAAIAAIILFSVSLKRRK